MNEDKTEVRSAEPNLLFGVMAVQLKFIAPGALMEASAAWAVSGKGLLKDYLIERGLLTEKIAAMIEGVIGEQVGAHQGDLRATLDSFGGDRAVRESFAASSLLVAGKLESIGGEPAPTPAPAVKTPEAVSRERGRYLSEEEILEDTGRLTLEHPGRYTMESEHGRGGIGRVLVAYDAHIGREIAIKELIPERTGTSLTPERSSKRSAVVTSRFLREARITGQLEHPAIVPVYELGRRPDGSVYYTMKFVRGKTLAQALREAKTLDLRLKLLTHFHDLVNAVAYAHYRKVIHRDLKPQNVMVGEFGETVVIDWGLAKVKGKKDDRFESMEQEIKAVWDGKSVETIKGSPLGTPAYMSPEQAEGRLEAVDEHSDIWSLGAVLFEILTGRIPFEGVNAYDIMGRVLREEAPSVLSLEPEAPPELAAIVAKCLKKDPAERYASAEELAGDVENFLTGRLVSVYQYPFSALFKRWLKKWWPVAATTAAGIVVLLAVFAWSYLQIKAQRNHALSNIAQAYSAYGQWAEAERRWGAAELYYSQSLLMADRAQTRYALNYAHTAPLLAVRLQFTLKGNEGPVNDVAINPEGTLLAAGGEDKMVRLWDLGSGELSANLAGHTAAVNAVVFSADGKYLASAGSDGAVRLWNPATGQLLQTLPGPAKTMKWLAFNPSGELLAGAGEDPVVMVWRTVSGEPAFKLVGHEKDCRGVAFSPAGDLLASWGKDQTIRLWDMATGAPRLALKGHTRVVLDAAFTPDGRQLVSAGWDNQIKVWSLPGGTELASISGPGPARFVRVSPNGRMALAGYDDGMVQLLGLQSKALLQTWKAHPGSLSHLIVLPGFQDFVTCGGDQMARLFTLADDNPANVIQAQVKPITRLAASPSGGLLALAGDESAIRVFRLEKKGVVKRLPGLSGRAWKIKAGPEDKFAVISGQSGEVKYLDLAGEELADLPATHQDGVGALAISPDGRWLVTGSWDKTVGVFDLKSRTQLYRLSGPADKVWAVAIIPAANPNDSSNSLVAAGGDDPVIRVWSLATGRLLRELSGHTGRVGALAVSPEGKLLASASLDKTIRLWKLDAKPAPTCQVLSGHTNGVGSLDLSPDGKRLASGGLDNTVRVWDVDSGRLLHTLAGHQKWVRSVQFSADGRFIISSAEDSAIKIWDAASGKLERSLSGTTDSLRCVAVRPDFGLLAAGSGDRLIRLWDPRTGELLHVLRGHPGSVEQVAFVGPSLLISADDQGQVLLWPFLDDFFQDSPPDLFSRAQQETGLGIKDMEITPGAPTATQTGGK